MAAISVWYDLDCDQIWVGGEDRSYAPRSLAAFIDPETGKIGIRPKASTGADIVLTAVGNLVDQGGTGFASALEAKAYLDKVFSRQRSVGDAYVIGFAVAAPGQTLIPLDTPPTLLSSVRVEVNGLVYRAPDIAASSIAVTWLNPDFELSPTDQVTVVYS